MKGPYAPGYWALILCNGIVPQLLWFKWVRTNMAVLFVISIIVNIGMWLERFVIVITSLHADLPALELGHVLPDGVGCGRCTWARWASSSPDARCSRGSCRWFPCSSCAASARVEGEGDGQVSARTQEPGGRVRRGRAVRRSRRALAAVRAARARRATQRWTRTRPIPIHETGRRAGRDAHHPAVACASGRALPGASAGFVDAVLDGGRELPAEHRRQTAQFAGRSSCP